MAFDKLQFEQEEAGLTDLIQHVLNSIRSAVRMDFGFVSEFNKGRRIFRYVDGYFAGIKPGDSDPLVDSYCYHILNGQMPDALCDASTNSLASSITPLRIGAHLSVPITLHDGGLFGTLCCLSRDCCPDLGESQLSILRLGAQIIASILSAAGIHRDHYLAVETRVRNVLTERAIGILYQPIYKISEDRVVAFEALSRFKGQPQRSPDLWFADAVRVGLGPDLEFLAVEEAMAGFLLMPQATSISLNLSPDAIASQRFAELFAAMPLDRVILEVTEHSAIGSYETLISALAPLRAQGLRLAIDDVGAGYSSFRHVLDLAPDIIKLDISLIRNIDLDQGRQALVEAISHFGSRIGCEIVAEGVETKTELSRLVELGVTKVQGYLISKPLSLHEAMSSTEHIAQRMISPRTKLAIPTSWIEPSGVSPAACD